MSRVLGLLIVVAACDGSGAKPKPAPVVHDAAPAVVGTPDARPRPVHPAPLADSLPLTAEAAVFDHELSAALVGGELTLRYSKKSERRTLDPARLDAEIPAFGVVFVIEHGAPPRVALTQAQGPFDRELVTASILSAAADGGWPAAELAGGMPGEVEGIQTYRTTSGAWVARVGVYTGRIWIDAR